MITGTAIPATDTTLIIKRVFAAPRQKVFDAWTQSAILKKWFGPSDEYEIPVAEIDLRVGGKYRIAMKHIPKGAEHVVIGEFREIQSPERLVYTWAWEGEPAGAETQVTVEFRDLDGSTEVMLKHELFASIESREQHNQGWTGCMNRLVEIL